MSDTGLTPADESMKGDTMSDADTVLILRCCRPDGSSHNGFVWPRSGPVEAPDWSPSPECGHGLHGWLWGEGDADASRHWRCDGALWLVVEVAADAVVELGGKVKFQRGHVVRSGLRDEVIPWLVERCPGRAILFGTATAGAGGIATR